MQTIQAVTTGLIQGLSEFLPISSSAHITFSNVLFNFFAHGEIGEISKQEEIFFDISVHLATLFAVLIYFKNDLKEIFCGFFNSVKEKNFNDKNVKTVGYIALSTVITGVIGLLIKNPVEKLITDPEIICVLLFITGLILLLSEKMYKGNKEIDLKNTIIISIAQGLAVFPGFSRSGFTIAAAIFSGVDRIKAARFSFLMSIPVILLASLAYPLLELDFTKISGFNLKAILFGFITAFASGYLCIKYFMRLLEKLSLRIFGYYCLVVSVGLFLLLQVFYHP